MAGDEVLWEVWKGIVWIIIPFLFSLVSSTFVFSWSWNRAQLTFQPHLNSRAWFVEYLGDRY